MNKRYEHLHYCEYRDTETGLVASNYIEVMNEQDQKIKELEAKLAESENKVKDLEFRNKNLEHSLSVAPNANAGQRARIVELKGINHKLKQQLAEKEKEIEKCNDEWREICDGKLETINRLIKEKHELQQSQTQTAIAELNNILDTFAFFVNEEKESIVSPDGNGNLSLLEYIENRIDALKGEPKC